MATKPARALDLVVRVPRTARPALPAVCAAAASATALLMSSGGGLLEDDDLLGSYGDPIRKLVWRTQGSAWLRVSEAAQVVVACGTAEVAVLAPRRRDARPSVLKTAQLSGFDLSPGGEWHPPGNSPRIWLPAEGMSAGKATAQAAHAAQLLLLRASHAAVQAWRSDGFAVGVSLSADRREFARRAAEADVVVDDRGFTEVAPGTTTACASWHGGD
jgi:hypothetical protein